MDEAANTAPKRNWFSPIREMFTEKDNQTYDFIRVFGAIGILWYMGCETYAVACKGQVFDPGAVSLGLSGLIVAVGAGVAARAITKSENGCG